MSHGISAEAPQVAEHAKGDLQRQFSTSSAAALSNQISSTQHEVALLTGGGDKPYALGLAKALTGEGICLDFIGSDELAVSELLSNPRINFLNLRGDQRSDANGLAKMLRVMTYYGSLLSYATRTKAKIFHILWNNKFEFFDRTVLMLYYKLLRKRIVFTAHNVNAGKRDGKDSLTNRFSLRTQYRLSDHIFVHTEKMKSELTGTFDLAKEKVSVIPFGINNTVPNTNLTPGDAKARLGVAATDRTLLFFGNIARYKGLHCLLAAFSEAVRENDNYRLIIAGRPKRSDEYWREIRQTIELSGNKDRIMQRIEFVPDEETELYFKAADVLVLPYTLVFQSGVLFLSYAFGLPVIASDVGSLAEEIISGETGFVFRAGNVSDLARSIGDYFDSKLFTELEKRRAGIMNYAAQRYSWSKVAAITRACYSELAR